MAKKIFVVALVTIIAVVLSATVNAHLVVLLAIVGGSIVGLSSNMIEKPVVRAEALTAFSVISAASTILSGVITGQILPLGILLGLAVGLPIGVFFSRE
ncbi:MAG TPA: hypothetical protein VI791_03380 [Patescibacteria group bacterium]|nr:hypothetical protein [Patescibacteria group bacterium]